LIDVGTGAGFPGIPIKILNPDCSIVLLDSLNKRIKFLEHVINELNLKNIECIHGRAEDVSREKIYRGCFDFAVSRAVANLSTLSEYCIPFLKTCGIFISYKSDKSDDEIMESENAINCLGSELTKIETIKLPNSDIVRNLVIITSKKPVSNKYPRKAGIPLKEPL
jgi:16S rRNA (guanine527-N7)-methyltransferase